MRNKIDPRSKIIIVAVISSLAVIYRGVLELSVLFAVSIAVALIFKVDMLNILMKLKRFVALLFGITILQSIFTFQGNRILFIGDFTLLTDFGIARGIEFFVRMGIILMMGMLLANSSQQEVTQALIQFKMPYELAFMATLGARFLPILKDEFVDSLNSLMLRGIEVKKLKFKQKLSVYTYILTPVVSNSILKAKDLSIAMELRGFRVMDKRTSFRTLKFCRADIFIITLSLFFLSIGIAWKIIETIIF